MLPPGRARAGADHQPEPALARRTRRSKCRSWTTGVAAGFLLVRTGSTATMSGRPGTGRGTGRAAAGTGASRRLHAGTGRDSSATWRCSGSGVPTCWPAGNQPATTSRSPRPGRWPSTSSSRTQPQAAGLLRLLACCAPEPSRPHSYCSPGPDLADRSVPRPAPLLSAAGRLRWPSMTPSPGCAATR